MKIILLIPFLVLIAGCNAPKKNLTVKELILSNLQEEYTESKEQKDRISNSIVSLQRNDNYVIMTTSFQSIITGEYKALLYVIENDIIKDKIERLNYKYHPGVFELSNDLKDIQNEILYRILLPTSSVPQVVILHEYFEINVKKKIISQFEFRSEERDCTMGREKGELIKRSIDSENGKYFLNKSIYEFDCEDFEFEKEIESLNLISKEIEKLSITKPKLH